MSQIVLRVSGASKRFGGLQALSDVGIQIGSGQIYGLIGPNGAGKTTFFNVITGLYPPDSGEFILADKPYKPAAVHQVAREGIARTFQNIRLFPDMTALENVMVGRHVRTNSALIGAVFRTRHFRTEEKAIRDRAHDLLNYVGISRYADFRARTGRPFFCAGAKRASRNARIADSSKRPGGAALTTSMSLTRPSASSSSCSLTLPDSCWRSASGG